MSFSASRLTLYALLSSIEDDLRNLILVHLASALSPLELLKSSYDETLEKYRKDLGDDGNAPTVADLLPYINYSDAYQFLNAHGGLLPQPVAKYIKLITPQLEKLAPIRNRVAHGRPLNFDDLAITTHLAESLIKKDKAMWVELDGTVRRLETEPSFVFGLSIPTYELDIDDKKHNLPQPDFDETGFLGRNDQVKEVIRRCLGPYPVITLTGEGGGVGKTALALKVAYDILDLKTSPFDSIVWTTSKTTTLTPHEIVRIKGAITDSLGLFQDIATTLAGDGQKQGPLEEVLEYLAEFKILLILDNLETVLDERIREFLQAMPSGSKVLITSRVGLGAFEFPYKVPSLETSESVNLLRALAKVRGVPDLARLPLRRLETYCERMKNNPGWIKWFVAAVRAGKRPEEVLESSEMFLDFCMSGVYKYLSADARQVLRSMLSVPDPHSQAELAFLNGMEAIDLQRALQLLLTTNFIQMNGILVGSTIESRYVITELGREFLIKHHPATPIEHGQFIQKRRLLVAAGEEIKSERNTNPFSYRSISTRSASDLIIARYLLDALAASDKKHFKEADNYIATAKKLAPSFFEVHRVEAVIRVAEENYPAAREAYERATEYEPESAPVRFWYGNFLLRYADDLDGALRELNEALRLAPESAEVKLELARVYTYRSEFNDAEQLLSELFKQLRLLSEWTRRKLYDFTLVFHYRRAEHNEYHHDSVRALKDLVKFKGFYLAIPTNSRDARMTGKISKLLPAAKLCAKHLIDPQQKAEAQEVLDWMRTFAGDSEPPDDEITSQIDPIVHTGTVTNVKPSFAFIREAWGPSIFFHRSALNTDQQWPKVVVGATAKFKVGIGSDGRPRAVEVEIIDAGGPNLHWPS